jgi:uncharacterized protein YbjT (DUF2867 family)
MTQASRYLVTAASGRIGSRVALGLLDAGHTVRVVTRERSHVAALVERGAEAAVGDLSDPAFADRAFSDVTTAFLLVRADRTSRDFRRAFADVGRQMAASLARHRVRRGLFLSALGAHDDKHRGLILVHRDVELALAGVPGLDLVSLRAPFFFENLFYFQTAMRARGGLFTPIDPDVAIDIAATPDIAAQALRLLSDPSTPTGPHELRSEPVTLRRIAGELAGQLRRPFPAARTTRDDDVAAMVAAGSTHDFAHLMNDAWDTFSRDGRIGDPTARWTTTSTPIADLVRTLLVPRLS